MSRNSSESQELFVEWAVNVDENFFLDLRETNKPLIYLTKKGLDCRKLDNIIGIYSKFKELRENNNLIHKFEREEDYTIEEEEKLSKILRTAEAEILDKSKLNKILNFFIEVLGFPQTHIIPETVMHYCNRTKEESPAKGMIRLFDQEEIRTNSELFNIFMQLNTEYTEKKRNKKIREICVEKYLNKIISFTELLLNVGHNEKTDSTYKIIEILSQDTPCDKLKNNNLFKNVAELNSQEKRIYFTYIEGILEKKSEEESIKIIKSNLENLIELDKIVYTNNNLKHKLGINTEIGLRKTINDLNEKGYDIQIQSNEPEKKYDKK